MPFKSWSRAHAPRRAEDTLVHADALYNFARYLTRDPGARAALRLRLADSAVRGHS